MGKASKWFHSIFGLKKSDPTTQHPSSSKDKRRWNFVKSYREKDSHSTTSAKRDSFNGRESKVVDDNDVQSAECEDANKHAIAVAAASAAVADAAVAAAQAAAAVVKLTSNSGRCGNYSAVYVSGFGGARHELAAIKIQSTFRGYLARRALRALRGLVRLQALVRGHIERKRTTDWLRKMQALLRAQERARARHAEIFESAQSSGKSSNFHQPGPPTPEKFEHSIRSKNAKYHVSSAFNRNGSKSNGRVIGDHDKSHVGWNWSDHHVDNRSRDQKGHSPRIGICSDEKTDKILEIDTGKPHFTPTRTDLFHSSHLTVFSEQCSHSFTPSKDLTTHQSAPNPSSGEVQSLSPLKFSHEVDESSFCTAEHSPRFFSASSIEGSSKRSPFTSAKSYSSQTCLSGYSAHPNYMAYTESSRAKVRCLSAPKQRPQYERSSSTKRNSINGFAETKSIAQKFSSLHANFTNKAYPGSGRLDVFGMSIRHRY